MRTTALAPFEFRRKLAHILFGILTTLLVFIGVATAERALILLPVAYGMLLLVKAGYFPVLTPAFESMEREHDLRNRPGVSVMAFLVSLWLLLMYFPQRTVLGSLMIWTFGDSVGHLFGASFGRIPSRINPAKNIEGAIAAFLFAVLGANIFVTNSEALFGSGFAVLVEMLPHRVAGRHVPDNFTVPLAAAAGMAFAAAAL